MCVWASRRRASSCELTARYPARATPRHPAVRGPPRLQCAPPKMQAASRVAVVGRVRIEECPGRPIPAQPVGPCRPSPKNDRPRRWTSTATNGLSVADRYCAVADDVGALVAAHHDRHVARSIPARTSRTGRTPRCVTLPSSLSSSNGTERRAAIDALVLVELRRVHSPRRCRRRRGPRVRSPVALTLAPRSVGPGNQSQALREEGTEHAVAIDRLLEGEPGHLVQAEHDRDAVGHLDVERRVFQAQRQVPVEAGVGGRPHVRREPDAARGRRAAPGC